MSNISTRPLTRQQLGVLECLELRARTYTYLGDLTFVTGYPEASIRRTIRELRQQGYNITFSPQGDSRYVYYPA